MRLIIICLGLFLGLSFSATPTVYSFNDLWTMALSNNVGLRIQAEKVIQANSDITLAESALAPAVDLGGSLRSSVTSSGLKPTAGLSLSASLPLYDAGRLGSKVEASTLSKKMADIQAHSTLVDLGYSLKVQALELLRQVKLLDLNQLVVNRRQQQVDLVRLRYKAGLENIGSVYTTEVNLTVSQEERKTILRKINEQQEALRAMTGLTPSAPFSVSLNTSTPTPLAPNFGITQSQHDRLTLKTMSLEQAKLDLVAAESGLAPKLSLSGGADASQSLSTGIFDSSLSFGLSAQFSLFDGGATRAQIQRSTSIIREREQILQQEKLSLQNESLQAYNDLQDAISTRMTSQKYREANQERSNIGDKRYSTGFIDFDSWLLIENELLQSEKNELNAQINGAEAFAKWQQIQGGIAP